ncbi:MAG: hypothetical protein ACXAHE_16815 [Roseburia sp. 1XD42-69]
MSYSTNMAGLDLFTAPFRNAQASRTATASRPHSSRKLHLPQPNAAVSPAQQPKAVSLPQPVKPKAPVHSSRRKPDVPEKACPRLKRNSACADGAG